jgi:alanine dehydrogenase
MPGAVARTSTSALTNATIPYACEIASKGWERAIRENPSLSTGVNVVNGNVVYKAVAEALDLPYTPLLKAI